MAEYTIRKGLDIKLHGHPGPEIEESLHAPLAVMYPRALLGVKHRLKVSEGDVVKRGAVVTEDKRDTAFKLRAPAGGTIRSIVRGERRFVEKIIIEVDETSEAEQFEKFAPRKIKDVPRSEMLDHLRHTGYLAYILQRPFGKLADIRVTPKSIFVNAMNTAPFQADAGVVVEDDPDAFQAGLDMLTSLTDGPVHLCVGPGANPTLRSAQNVRIHTFRGKHPAGNTSVHISRVDPMKPTDVIWTVKAVDLVLIGRLLLDGRLPASRLVAIGGHGVRNDARKHYRMKMGGVFGPVIGDKVKPGEMRWIHGDVLAGRQMEVEGALSLYQSSLTVIPEGRERRFLGWLLPGFDVFSFMRTYPSGWYGGRPSWRLTTNQNGGRRAMVLTGYYNKVMPMNIMVDYLVRAVLAGDTDEAVKLGILETLPEDFALCEFICPCKTEIQTIIADGLAMIEEEGI